MTRKASTPPRDRSTTWTRQKPKPAISEPPRSGPKLQLLQEAVERCANPSNFVQAKSLLFWQQAVFTAFYRKFPDDPGSIQSHVLTAYTGCGLEHQILEEFKRAESSRISALTTLSSKWLMGGKITEQKPLAEKSEKVAATLVAWQPDLIRNLISLFPKGHAPQITEDFILKVADEIRKKKEAGGDFPLALIPFLMIQFWTCPACPLWLMSNMAGTEVLKRKFNFSCAAGTFAVMAKRAGLKRPSHPPIMEITGWKELYICNFSVAKDLPDDVANRLQKVSQGMKKRKRQASHTTPTG